MKRIYIIISMLSFMFASCSGFLEEYSQDTAYVRGYEDLDELLLGSVYMPTNAPEHMGYTYGTDGWYYPYIHLMTDEVQENIKSSSSGALWDARERYFGYYTWQQQVGIDALGTSIRKESSDWNRIYKHINIANMILASIDEQSTPKEEDELEVMRIKGEAYFLRGAYYFILVNLYGKPYTKTGAKNDLGVPIKNTEYIEDKVYGRNTVEEVYAQVLADLGEAEKCLEKTIHKSIYRADITATYLLLSRVHLYMQNWEMAESYAKKVLSKQDDLRDLNMMEGIPFFLDTTLPEVIFTMGMGGIRYTISGLPKDLGISDELYALYKDNDLRKSYFVKYNESGGYVEYVKGGTIADFSRTSLSANFLFRTAEAYLNLAEAMAYQGKEDDARKALNDLRVKRLSVGQYANSEESGADLIELIREERERELCLEGHRWFDLRRYMVCEKQPYTKTIRKSYTTFEYVSWTNVPVQTVVYQLEENDAAYTLPIPKEVLEYNTGMKNNERGVRPVVETINY